MKYYFCMPRVTSKGQVTVPVGVRYALGIGPGDTVVFAIEDGRGVFRRAARLADLAAAFPLPGRAAQHPLEALLVAGDDALARDVEAHARGGTRLRLADAVLLELAVSLLGRGAAPLPLANALRDVLAERAIRVDHPAAVREAIDELARGGDPLLAYALARG
jgi:AbrB family looped-hinge helix DNA binding protein